MTLNEEAHIAAYKLRNRRLGWLIATGIFGVLVFSYLTRSVLYHVVFK